MNQRKKFLEYGNSLVAFINQRHWVALLALWALTICYMMRFCISLAITVITPHGGSNKVDPKACPNFVKSTTDSVSKDRREYLYHWDEHTQGIVLSSFFWGYVITQIPGGIISDRLGSKKVLLVTVTCTSLLTLLTPLTIVHGDWYSLVVVRVLLGMMQGAFYSSLHNVVSSWIPNQEMGIWGTVVFVGAQLGNALSFLLSGIIIDGVGEENWGVVFYIYGGIGLLWSITCFFTAYATPQDHPSLKPKEQAILDKHIASVSKAKGVKKTPFRSVVKSLPSWAFVAGMVGHDWGFFALTVDLPKYFNSVMRFNIKENGLYCSIGYFNITFVAIGSGMLVDYLESRRLISLRWNRIFFTTLASVLPSLGIVASAYTNCNRVLAVLFLVIGISFMGTFYPSLKLNPIDLSPNHASFVGGIGGAFGALTGIIVPYLIGVLVPNGFLSEWRCFFWITFIVMTATNLFYAIFASADTQSWNSEGMPSE